MPCPNGFKLLNSLALILAALLLLPVIGNAATAFERPVPEGGGPSVVRCAIAIFDVDEISDANQNFTVSLFARFEWDDPSEAHGATGKITKALDDVWYPHLFFANMQKTWSTLGGEVKISPDGTVVYRQQFWGDFSQPMNMRNFPFDQHSFEIRVVAAGVEEFGEIEMIQDPENESFVAETLSVADWKIVKSDVSTEPFRMPTGDQEASFAFRFTAERLSHHHVIKNMAPLLMIVGLSWVVFWLDPKDGGSQLGVAVTAFLTVIAYHAALNSRLPEFSYLTRFDIFVFGVNLLVALAMIEVVVTTGLARSDRENAARRLDSVCRLVFPAALVLVAIYAFMWH